MSDVFEKTGEFLERHSGFNKIQSRGTIRLLLKDAGLNPRTIEKDDMMGVLETKLGEELEKRGVADFGDIVQRVADDVQNAAFAESAYDIFSKI